MKEQADDLSFRLETELAEKEGITETLKAQNQVFWVPRMNAVRETTTEIFDIDVIYA